MFKKKDLPVASLVTTSMTFEFVKGDVRLNFSLNIDSPKQLTDFAEVLQAAREAVQKKLEQQTSCGTTEVRGYVGSQGI